MFLVVFNYFVFKGFLKSINRVCFDDFAVKRIIEFRFLKKIQTIVSRLFHSRVSVEHESPWCCRCEINCFGEICY